VAATTFPAADPVSSLGRPTSSPAVPGPVSTLGHVVLPGGAAASPSTHNNSLGSAQHHCRPGEATEPEGASLDHPATARMPKLTNAQIKKLPAAQRARYKEAQRKASQAEAQHAPTTHHKVGTERDSVPMPREEMPHCRLPRHPSPLSIT